MRLLHTADILCDASAVFLDIAHLVHHFRQVGIMRIRAVLFHQVSFGKFYRQRSRIAHHNTVAEDRNLHTPRAVIVAMGHSVYNGLEDDGARYLKFNLVLYFLISLTKTNRQFRHHPTGCLADLLRHTAFKCFVVLNWLHSFCAKKPCAFNHCRREKILRIVGEHKQCSIAGLVLSQQSQVLKHRNRVCIFG